jgi:alcohol dehydrogenase class IV
MTIVTRAAYRGYQGVFKIAAAFLDFTPPELLEGPGSVRRLPELIKSKGVDKVLVVTDKGILGLRLLDGLFERLTTAGIGYVLFDGVQPNPTIQNIEDALKLYDDAGCKAIIAVGGGSPMDCAKAAGARASNRGRTIPQMRGQLKVSRRPPLLFAVPTTAGTGSETTVAAVVTDPSTHEKYAINSPKLIPPYAVLDPELTVGLPPHITSTTGMDALTHAVEAYIGRSNTAATREKAEKAVKLIFDNIRAAYADGSNLPAREAMLKAAHYAGFAFTRAYVGYVHAIAHNLGGLYGIPHGLANAVVLPYVLDFFGPAAYRPLARLADIAGVPGKGEAEKARGFVAAVRGLNESMRIQDKFDQIKEADIPVLVRRALREGNPLYPVPKIMDAADCEAIVRRLMN